MVEVVSGALCYWCNFCLHVIIIHANKLRFADIVDVHIQCNMYIYMHVCVYVGWGRVENGCGVNFLCAVINFYNLFVSVFLVCVGRKWRRQRSSPWPLTNRLTTAPTSSVIGSFRSASFLSLLSVSFSLSLSLSYFLSRTPLFHYLSLSLLLSPVPPPSLTIPLILTICLSELI